MSTGSGKEQDIRRRRASTGRRMEAIMELARGLPPARQVLADSLEDATVAQMAFMETWMREEIASRGRSKRARLLRQAGFPQSKELDGYDWTPVRFPVDYGRESLESLEFTGRHKDVVLFGPPGTGKTHLAIALGRKARREGTETRFSAGRRAGRAPAARQNGQPARQGTRHDRQGGAPDHRRARLRARR